MWRRLLLQAPRSPRQRCARPEALAHLLRERLEFGSRRRSAWTAAARPRRRLSRMCQGEETPARWPGDRARVARRPCGHGGTLASRPGCRGSLRRHGLGGPCACRRVGSTTSGVRARHARRFNTLCRDQAQCARAARVGIVRRVRFEIRTAKPDSLRRCAGCRPCSRG